VKPIDLVNVKLIDLVRPIVERAMPLAKRIDREMRVNRKLTPQPIVRETPTLVMIANSH